MSGLDSYYDNPSTWRQSIEGIKVRTVDLSGTFEDETAVITRTVLVQASQIDDFANAILPKVQVVNDIPVWTAPHNFTANGLGLYARSISWRSHVDGKPVDPFLQDTSAPSNTYHDVIEATITYKPLPPDSQNFMTITARAAGEFIHTTTPKGTIVDDTSPGDNYTNRDPYRPVIVRVPTTEWTVTWHRLPRSIWNSYVYKEVRNALGKVNSTKFKPIFDAPPETVLFTGFDFKDEYTWRSLQANPLQPATDTDILPCTVSFHFLEKHVKNETGDTDKVHGHNSVYIPEEGAWREIEVNENGDNIYKTIDLNNIFLQTQVTGTTLTT